MHATDFGQVIGLVAVIGIFGIPILAVIGHYAHESIKAWLAVSLKRDMVARGYTAQEIVAVIAADAGSKGKPTLPDVPPAKPIKQPQFS